MIKFKNYDFIFLYLKASEYFENKLLKLQTLLALAIGFRTKLLKNFLNFKEITKDLRKNQDFQK